MSFKVWGEMPNSSAIDFCVRLPVSTRGPSFGTAGPSYRIRLWESAVLSQYRLYLRPAFATRRATRSAVLKSSRRLSLSADLQVKRTVMPRRQHYVKADLLQPVCFRAFTIALAV